MKKILVIGLFILPFLLQAQAPPKEGMIRYLVTHNWAKKFAAVDYMSKASRERMMYMWGNRSEWKMYCDMYYNANETYYFDSDDVAEKNDDGYSWKKDAYGIKRNFVKMTQQDAIQHLGKVYMIEDTMQTQNWQVQNDLKEIAGHICMKAFFHDTLRMQKITAWFAQDIPLSGGPERFCGLPGLIMEVDINDGAMTITAEYFKAQALTNQLEIPKKWAKGKKINETTYVEMLKKHFAERRKAEEPPFWGIRY
jgi:GLPGLI family protein